MIINFELDLKIDLDINKFEGIGEIVKKEIINQSNLDKEVRIVR